MYQDIQKLNKKHKSQTIREMKSLGHYKKEFTELINRRAHLLTRYTIQMAQFEADCYPGEEQTGTGGTKKSARQLVLESVLKELRETEKELMLTPKALKELEAKESEDTGMSKLEAISKGIDLKVL